MGFRKAVALVFVLALAGSLFSDPVSGSGTTVVLSSDNAADLALATFVAHSCGGELVVSPWGTFNSSVLSVVLRKRPGRVIIIGGPVAVPGKYSSALSDKGLSVVRFAGKDRFETADLVLNWSLEMGYRPRGDFYILDGWDEGGIAYTLQNHPDGLVLIVSPHHDLVNAISEKTGLTSKMASAEGTGYGRTVYIDPTLFNGSPPCNCTPVRIDEKKAVSLSIGRLREVASHIGNESLRKALMAKADEATRLAVSEPEKAKELVREGLALAYSAIAGKPGSAQANSGSTD